MAKFKFAGHEVFHDDEYTKECVQIDVKAEDCVFRLAFVRKVFRNGGSTWDAVSAGVTQNGKKKYIKGFLCSDNFFEHEVKEFLKNRGWEKSQKNQNSDVNPF